MKIDIKIKRNHDLGKFLNGELAKEAARVSVKEHAADLQSLSQQLTPVGETGFLKANQTIDISDDGLKATIVAEMEYSGYVEYGTRYMDARPFMGPAFNNVAPHFEKDLERIAKTGGKA